MPAQAAPTTVTRKSKRGLKDTQEPAPASVVVSSTPTDEEAEKTAASADDPQEEDFDFENVQIHDDDEDEFESASGDEAFDSEEIDSEADLSSDDEDAEADEEEDEAEASDASDNRRSLASDSGFEETIDANYNPEDWPELPEIDPEYNSDTSDEEVENTVGNIPAEWYAHLPHIGYNKEGKPIARPAQKDQIDEFLSKVDDPKSWQTVFDNLEGKERALTAAELTLLKRLQDREVPDPEFDPHPDTVEWFTSETMTMPLTGKPTPKNSFLPSKWEAQKVMRLVRAIRKGVAVGRPKVVPPKKHYDIWKDKNLAPTYTNAYRQRKAFHIAAPKIRLPGHTESYNPPVEYLMTPEDEERLAKDPTAAPPTRYTAMRQIPVYSDAMRESFERCLDLYLCPREMRKKSKINADKLVPELPDPEELRPWPSLPNVIFRGHRRAILCSSIDPSGTWLASGSEDCTLRIWDIETGRCSTRIKFEEKVTTVAWSPDPAMPILLAGSGTHVYVIENPQAPRMDVERLRNYLRTLPSPPNKNLDRVEEEFNEGAIKILIETNAPVNHLAWHRRGDYFVSVSTLKQKSTLIIHQLSKRNSQFPFTSTKQLISRVLFHPSQPILFIATQKRVKVFNLQRHELVKTLKPNAKWISSMALHPSGDHVLLGSYDRRFMWFDMDWSATPYKSLRFHSEAVRDVAFHRSYPLSASASDDGTVNIFHGTVYDDLLTNPLIVPLKTLRAHKNTNYTGVMTCQWHPTQPWLITGGGDSLLKLWTT
ncbi:hypothetical protein CXG81DRAFT_11365 [Caulochytrium protostelioides]|uniref:Ribosome biogenesis protein ERB1 n=1 Tax=Caulochytrium protostelioides TaxID=1555241 RepID=A0A4P9X9H2_9FUNG|nr:BOP1NT-domain-containing protein [Caulochytrium protostelioides]RKP01958.1 hypothetical protein CXG81DRAFT_11365 [Caulochytrium protostelioides]|eukprot:RKP01958.1 hypothetical protein CXG81DRAFT_11365 [Caulochytrium protostelioides]